MIVKSSTLPEPRRAARAAAVFVLVGALAGCGGLSNMPTVDKAVSYDENGRPVVSYRICEQLPVIGETACRTETVVHNYCYRSLARVDCYEQPQPGRAAMRTTP